MKVNQTVKFEKTEEEKQALKIVYNMLTNLSWEEECAIAEKLGYGCKLIRHDLMNCITLVAELQKM